MSLSSVICFELWFGCIALLVPAGISLDVLSQCDESCFHMHLIIYVASAAKFRLTGREVQESSLMAAEGLGPPVG